MPAIIEGLRSGAFVTRERIRLVGVSLLLAFAAGLGFLALTSNGLNDAKGRPLGTDFSNVYAAGTYVGDGDPAAPFDPARQYAREQAIFGAETPFYGWHYPPFFLFVAAALARLPYVPALVVWQGVTLALYFLSIRLLLLANPPSIVPTLAAAPRHDKEIAAPAMAGMVGGGTPDRLWLLLAAAYPAVFVNLGHGHNGLLTAALIGTALACLDRRPIVAGILFGLLVYKPQFGMMIPLVLSATGRWRTFAAAATTVAALVIATLVAFGTPTWESFLASAHFTRAVVLEAGDTGWHKIQSVFALVRMWGGPVALAYAAQSCVTCGAAAAVVWLWRLRVDFALQAAALVLASVLATPYSLDYDLTALAPAIAYLAVHGMRSGFAPYEKTALAALWLAPLVARAVAQAILVPLGLIAMIGVFCLILARASREKRGAETWHPTQYPIG